MCDHLCVCVCEIINVSTVATTPWLISQRRSHNKKWANEFPKKLKDRKPSLLKLVKPLKPVWAHCFQLNCHSSNLLFSHSLETETRAGCHPQRGWRSASGPAWRWSSPRDEGRGHCLLFTAAQSKRCWKSAQMCPTRMFWLFLSFASSDAFLSLQRWRKRKQKW